MIYRLEMNRKVGDNELILFDEGNVKLKWL